MNKQQLAARIWRMANNMRSSIDAGEYKDFILGFIFYRFLSEYELSFLRKEGWDDEDIEGLDGEDAEDVKYIRERIGYFIKYGDLYTTWVDPETEFQVGTVRDALSAFQRNLDKQYHRVYDKIFETLGTSLTKLGDNEQKRTKAVADILELIKPIPMDNKQGYDTLGFIYEYLIQNFAANAGKKAGEFYTPHEVSQMMSEIVAYELDGKDDISIYDPTSGSASLLLNIGTSITRRNGNPDSIKYFAQELKQATYSLTRMNLVMKGIKPANIVTRNADTLDEDWPMLDDTDEPLRVDACVSNPPYSAKWSNKDKDGDPRFSEYGIAPKGKADYAFLLHNLYHMKSKGIMCIVLPHGVLFRGDSEGQIRKELVDQRNIYAVIGLPANIFFGTGIPTIVMVLKKQRDDDGILFIDASKGFVKDGKKNRLRAEDIRRIVDAYKARADVEGYAHLASKDEVVANGYNLNIPRYVDSSEPAEQWDIYASMFGGVPDHELDGLSEYWDALPGLREALFESDGKYSQAKADDIGEAVREHGSVAAFESSFGEAFDGFGDGLKRMLTDDVMVVKPIADEDKVVADVFERASKVDLVDPYALYQVLDDQWTVIANDVEALQQEDLATAMAQVDPNMVIKKNGDDEEEVQDKKVPWVGHVLPFELVQRERFADELAEIARLEAAIATCEDKITEAFEGLDEEEGEGDYVNDAGDCFDMKQLTGAIEALYGDESEEVAGLLGYRELLDAKADVPAQLAYVGAHAEVAWSAMSRKRDGTVTKANVNKRVHALCDGIDVDGDSLIARLESAAEAADEIKDLKKDLKARNAELVDATKEWIEGVDVDTGLELLRMKWVDAITERYDAVPGEVVDGLVSKLEALVGKYAVTYAEVGEEAARVQGELVEMLGRLVGSESDMAGIAELSKLLGGE